MRRLFCYIYEAACCGACREELEFLFGNAGNGILSVPSPAQADVIIVCGYPAAVHIKAIRDMASSSRAAQKIIACGACAAFGGVFIPGREVSRPALPSVKISVPGCPPGAADILKCLKEIDKNG